MSGHRTGAPSPALDFTQHAHSPMGLQDNTNVGQGFRVILQATVHQMSSVANYI